MILTSKKEQDKMSFTPSKYQIAIFDWISQGRGDGIVNAVAGAGKTTTLVMGAAQLSSTNSLFCAFNKHIAEELNTRLIGTGMQAKTIHSLGNGMLIKQLGGRTQIDNRKYDQLAKSYVKRHRDEIPYEERFPVRTAIKQLADMSRLTLTDPYDPEALKRMCDHYFDVAPDQIALRALPEILEQGERLAEMAKTIDPSYVPGTALLAWFIGVPYQSADTTKPTNSTHEIISVLDGIGLAMAVSACRTPACGCDFCPLVIKDVLILS